MRFFLDAVTAQLAVTASTPPRMVRPLVYYAARCSGGTAIHALLRDLLVLPGNHWKVQGTVLGFARAHPPRSLGYVNGRCANGTDSAVEAYLREFS